MFGASPAPKSTTQSVGAMTEKRSRFTPAMPASYSSIPSIAPAKFSLYHPWFRVLGIGGHRGLRALLFHEEWGYGGAAGGREDEGKSHPLLRMSGTPAYIVTTVSSGANVSANAALLPLLISSSAFLLTHCTAVLLTPLDHERIACGHLMLGRRLSNKSAAPADRNGSGICLDTKTLKHDAYRGIVAHIASRSHGRCFIAPTLPSWPTDDFDHGEPKNLFRIGWGVLETAKTRKKEGPGEVPGMRASILNAACTFCRWLCACKLNVWRRRGKSGIQYGLQEWGGWCSADRA